MNLERHGGKNLLTRRIWRGVGNAALGATLLFLANRNVTAADPRSAEQILASTLLTAAEANAKNLVVSGFSFVKVSDAPDAEVVEEYMQPNNFYDSSDSFIIPGPLFYTSFNPKLPEQPLHLRDKFPESMTQPTSVAASLHGNIVVQVGQNNFDGKLALSTCFRNEGCVPVATQIPDVGTRVDLMSGTESTFLTMVATNGQRPGLYVVAVDEKTRQTQITPVQYNQVLRDMVIEKYDPNTHILELLSSGSFPNFRLTELQVNTTNGQVRGQIYGNGEMNFNYGAAAYKANGKSYLATMDHQLVFPEQGYIKNDLMIFDKTRNAFDRVSLRELFSSVPDVLYNSLAISGLYPQVDSSGNTHMLGTFYYLSESTDYSEGQQILGGIFHYKVGDHLVKSSDLTTKLLPKNTVTKYGAFVQEQRNVKFGSIAGKKFMWMDIAGQGLVLQELNDNWSIDPLKPLLYQGNKLSYYAKQNPDGSPVQPITKTYFPLGGH